MVRDRTGVWVSESKFLDQVILEERANCSLYGNLDLFNDVVTDRYPHYHRKCVSENTRLERSFTL
jgi:hypothetical protein